MTNVLFTALDLHNFSQPIQPSNFIIFLSCRGLSHLSTVIKHFSNLSVLIHLCDQISSQVRYQNPHPPKNAWLLHLLELTVLQLLMCIHKIRHHMLKYYTFLDIFCIEDWCSALLFWSYTPTFVFIFKYSCIYKFILWIFYIVVEKCPQHSMLLDVGITA